MNEMLIFVPTIALIFITAKDWRDSVAAKNDKIVNRLFDQIDTTSRRAVDLSDSPLSDSFHSDVNLLRVELLFIAKMIASLEMTEFNRNRVDSAQQRYRQELTGKTFEKSELDKLTTSEKVDLKNDMTAATTNVKQEVLVSSLSIGGTVKFSFLKLLLVFRRLQKSFLTSY